MNLEMLQQTLEGDQRYINKTVKNTIEYPDSNSIEQGVVECELDLDDNFRLWED